jgi:hypothetical protein
MRDRKVGTSGTKGVGLGICVREGFLGVPRLSNSPCVCKCSDRACVDLVAFVNGSRNLGMGRKCDGLTIMTGNIYSAY